MFPDLGAILAFNVRVLPVPQFSRMYSQTETCLRPCSRSRPINSSRCSRCWRHEHKNQNRRSRLNLVAGRISVPNIESRCNQLKLGDPPEDPITEETNK